MQQPMTQTTTATDIPATVITKDAVDKRRIQRRHTYRLLINLATLLALVPSLYVLLIVALAPISGREMITADWQALAVVAIAGTVVPFVVRHIVVDVVARE